MTDKLIAPMNRISQEDFKKMYDNVNITEGLVYPPNKWISVKDRLPDDGYTVIFYCPGTLGGFMCVGYIVPEMNRGQCGNGEKCFWFVDMSENECFSENDVTHWMPLPEPPK